MFICTAPTEKDIEEKLYDVTLFLRLKSFNVAMIVPLLKPGWLCEKITSTYTQTRENILEVVTES